MAALIKRFPLDYTLLVENYSIEQHPYYQWTPKPSRHMKISLLTSGIGGGHTYLLTDKLFVHIEIFQQEICLGSSTLTEHHNSGSIGPSSIIPKLTDGQLSGTDHEQNVNGVWHQDLVSCIELALLCYISPCLIYKVVKKAPRANFLQTHRPVFLKQTTV